MLPILTSHFKKHIWMFQCFMGFLLEKNSFENCLYFVSFNQNKIYIPGSYSGINETWNNK